MLALLRVHPEQDVSLLGGGHGGEDLAEAIDPGRDRLAVRGVGPHVAAPGRDLVAPRMRCADVALTVADRVQRIMPISRLSDLRPLLQTKMTETLGMDMAEAVAESPLLCKGLRNIPTHIWVGANERPAFLDQARWLADGWPDTQLTIAANRHHFDVIDDLAEPDSEMVKALLV